MSDEQDTIDAWWHAQECDERWQRHMQLQAELTNLTEELKHENIRHDRIEVSKEGKL